MASQWALYDSTLGWLDFNETTGILVEEFEPNSAEVRGVVNMRPTAHGTYDETRYFGNKMISLSGKIRATGGQSIEDIATSLKRYLLPNKRPVLRWVRDGYIRDIDVRLEKGEQNLHWAVDNFHIEWVCPSPFWRDPTESVLTIPYSDSIALGGDPWPWLGGPSEVIEFEAGTTAIIPVPNTGVVEVSPVITIWGPIDGISLINTFTDKTFKIDTELEDGDYLVVDMYNHTAIVNDALNVFQSIDFASSEWWTLTPGSEDEIMMVSPNIPVGGTPFAVCRHYNLTT